MSLNALLLAVLAAVAHSTCESPDGYLSYAHSIFGVATGHCNIWKANVPGAPANPAAPAFSADADPTAPTVSHAPFAASDIESTYKLTCEPNPAHDPIFPDPSIPERRIKVVTYTGGPAANIRSCTDPGTAPHISTSYYTSDNHYKVHCSPGTPFEPNIPSAGYAVLRYGDNMISTASPVNQDEACLWKANTYRTEAIVTDVCVGDNLWTTTPNVDGPFAPDGYWHKAHCTSTTLTVDEFYYTGPEPARPADMCDSTPSDVSETEVVGVTAITGCQPSAPYQTGYISSAANEKAPSYMKLADREFDGFAVLDCYEIAGSCMRANEQSPNKIATPGPRPSVVFTTLLSLAIIFLSA